MKKTLLLFILFQSLIGISQSQEGCEKILSQNIKLDFSTENDFNILINNLSKLKNCGLKQIDIDFFSSGPMLAAIIVPTISDNIGEISYQNLFDQIIELKQQPEYQETIELFQASQDLVQRKVDIKNWDDDKILFEKLQTPPDLLNQIYLLVQQNSNSNKTYAELFNDLNLVKPSETQAEISAEKSYDGIFKNAGNVNYDDLLNKALELNKPLLLYFTGYACVNCRKLEHKILSDKSIEEKLNNEFYFVNLYVDDKKSLPENEQTESIINGKLIKYIGQKHSELQIRKFKNNYQPYLVIIDKNGNKVKEQGYTTDIKLFEEFLNIEK